MVLAVLTIVSAGFVVLHRNPVKSALALIVVMLSLGLLYMGLTASFLAVVQIMVYAGAVMVLFLFVLYLLNVGVESPFSSRLQRRLGAGLVGVLIGITLAGLIIVRSQGFIAVAAPPVGAEFGSIESAGELLFTRYLLPFELLSVVLLVAIIGAVLAARPRWPTAKLPPELWPVGGGSSTTDPAPGTAGSAEVGGE
jgi:NADH-quinone oxidoreductase subunit J